MPIKHSSNNRVLNGNARASDVAKRTVDSLVAVQNRRYDEAFKVQGYKAVLYTPLKSGVPCSCKNKARAASSLLGEDGKASPGLINELLTGEGFGVLPYGVEPSKTRTDEDGNEVLDSLYRRRNGTRDAPTTIEDGFSTTMDDPRARTIVPKVAGQKDNNSGYAADEFDNLVEMDDPLAEEWGLNETTRLVLPSAGSLSGGYYDVSCPICFGTGFVGGYSVHNGHRQVVSLTVGVPSLSLVVSGNVSAQFTEVVPYVSGCEYFSFTTVLPRFVQGVDSLRAFNNTVALPATISVDNTVLATEHELVTYCDGKPHVIKVAFASPTDVSHFELQLNQSREWTRFEFPRLNRSGDPLVVDDTDPFTINVSPVVPNIFAWCIIAESTYGKVLVVKSVNSWNTRRRQVLGWDCEVRVAQPSELFNLLPRRRVLETQNRRPLVRDNKYGHRRT